MPRTARQKSKTSVYHVMMRGINQQSIFEYDGDYEKFLGILETYKKEKEIEIYAYCLMDNHIHLLIKEGIEDISITMKRIGVSYVIWYNWQYNRKGHLFQDRYRSEVVENDAYLLTVLRYIHQNPVNAGLTKDIELYKWSSYNEYKKKPRIINDEFILMMFCKEKDKAIERFINYHMELHKDKCIDIDEDRKTLSDQEIRQLAKSRYNIELATLQNQPAAIQNEVLKHLKDLEGSSLRQISRLTGFTVHRILKV